MTTDPPPPLPGARLLFSLDPGVAHLDHASFGAVPVPVQRAQSRLRDEMEANPTRFFGTGIRERLTHIRRHLAGYLGAAPDGSALVANTDFAVTAALQAVALHPDDEVVTTDHGRAPVALAVDDECRRTGARHRVAQLPITARPAEVVAAVRAELTARTRLVIVDQVTSWTARILPVTQLVELVRSHGAAIFVDGTHAPGILPDPAADYPDFWAGDLHLWAYAPRPTGLLAVGGRWRDQIRPIVAGVDPTAGDAAGGPSGGRYPATVEWLGTADYSAWLAASVGLFTLRSIGLDAVRAHNTALAAYGQRVVSHALGTTGDRPGGGSGPGTLPMAVVELPDGIARTPTAAAALRQQIADELATEVGVTAWRGRGLLRLSAQVYNRAEEYDRLASGLPGLLRRLRVVS